MNLRQVSLAKELFEETNLILRHLSSKNRKHWNCLSNWFLPYPYGDCIHLDHRNSLCWSKDFNSWINSVIAETTPSFIDIIGESCQPLSRCIFEMIWLRIFAAQSRVMEQIQSNVYFSSAALSGSLILELKCAYLDGFALGAILSSVLKLKDESYTFTNMLAKQHYIERSIGLNRIFESKIDISFNRPRCLLTEIELMGLAPTDIFENKEINIQKDLVSGKHLSQSWFEVFILKSSFLTVRISR